MRDCERRTNLLHSGCANVNYLVGRGLDGLANPGEGIGAAVKLAGRTKGWVTVIDPHVVGLRCRGCAVSTKQEVSRHGCPGCKWPELIELIVGVGQLNDVVLKTIELYPQVRNCGCFSVFDSIADVGGVDVLALAGVDVKALAVAGCYLDARQACCALAGNCGRAGFSWFDRQLRFDADH